MEAFSLLKYWRSGGGATAAVDGGVTTILTAVDSPHDTDDDNDDGPFFDLEFPVPVEELEPGHKLDTGSSGTESDEEHETVLPVDELLSKGELVPDSFVQKPGTVSSPDELFFKGGLVPDQNPKSEPFHRFSNFQVLMLKLKKNKEGEKNGTKKEGKVNKLFTVKFKIEEMPIKSVFKRDNSSKKTCTGTKKTEKPTETGTKKTEKPTETGTDEKKFSKDAMRRYLKMVSKRYGERVRFSGEAAPPSPVPEKRKGSVVPSCADVAGRRRDDSLMMQQDGIQSAILHCKRSFNSSRDSEMSILSRSISDPCHDHPKPLNKSTK